LGLSETALVLVGLGLGACGEKPSSSERILALVEQHPGDDDALFLALLCLDLDAHRSLAERTHAPLHLARLADALSRTWPEVDVGTRDELADRCSDWERADPGNGMPMLVRGNVELHRGHLERALSLWKEAAGKECVDDLTEEARRKAWSLLRVYGIEDVACFPLVLRSNERLLGHVIEAAKALVTCGDEYCLRSQQGEAADCYEATLALAERFEAATRDTTGVLAVAYARSMAASSLVELALMRGEREAAEGFVALCEQNGRTVQLVEHADHRARDADPLMHLAPSLGEWLVAARGAGPSAAQTTLEERLRHDAAELLPYFESRVKVGEWKMYQGYLTPEDRAEAEGFQAEERALFDLYPSEYGEAQRRALLDSVRREDLRSRAIRALIHRRDPETVAALRGLLAAAAPDSDEAREYAFALAWLGPAEPDVVRVLVASLAEPWSLCTVGFRGLAATGDPGQAEAILAELRSATDLHEQEKRISAWFALRDLTGATLDSGGDGLGR
jgi:hypothetical protein